MCFFVRYTTLKGLVKSQQGGIKSLSVPDYICKLLSILKSPKIISEKDKHKNTQLKVAQEGEKEDPNYMHNLSTN